MITKNNTYKSTLPESLPAKKKVESVYRQPIKNKLMDNP